MCGGAMVTPRAAITASHCLTEDAVINNVHQYQAWAGRTVSAKDKVVNEKKFIVLNYFKHPQYNEKTLQNDIAVLSLETENKEPLAWTRWVRPVCLPEPYPRQKQLYKVGREATVSGFGLLSERETSMSSSLQHVKLDIVELEDCMKAYKGTTAKVDEQNFCAARAGKDACTGDSGGPMVRQGGDRRFYLVGVVSFGKGCARKGSPGVYARVDKFITWIRETVEGIERRHHAVPIESPISTTCPTAQTCPPQQTCPTCKSCPSLQTSPSRITCPPRTTVTCPTCQSCPTQRISRPTTCPPQTTTTCPTCKSCPPRQSCPNVCTTSVPISTRQPCPTPQPCPTCRTCPQTETWSSWSSQQTTTTRPSRKTSTSPSTCPPCETCQSCPKQSCPVCETCQPRETNSLLGTLLLAQQWQQPQSWQQTPSCPQCPPQRTCPQAGPVNTMTPQTTPTRGRPSWTRHTTRQPPPRPTPARPEPPKTQPTNVRETRPACSGISTQARCDWRTVIRVTEGYFGRHDDADSNCPASESHLLWFQRSLGCFHSDATEVLARRCNGRRTCYVSEQLFQSSLHKMNCEAQRPYALMKYSCERPARRWNNWRV